MTGRREGIAIALRPPKGINPAPGTRNIYCARVIAFAYKSYQSDINILSLFVNNYCCGSYKKTDRTR